MNTWLTDNHHSGDSYSSSDVLINPQSPYHTSCNGPNWVDDLTDGFNASVLTTKDYAIPGSAVDFEIIPNGKVDNSTDDFVHQLANYKKDFAKAPADSVFAVFFGINDINFSDNQWDAPETSTVMNKYSDLLEEVRTPILSVPDASIPDASQIHELIYVPQLYDTGTRTIIALNVPPIDRSPQASSMPMGPEQIKLWKAAVIEYNTALTAMLASLGDKYTDASIFQLNTTLIFDKVLDDPSYSKYTAGLKDLTDQCGAYEGAMFQGNKLPTKDYKSPQCEWAVNQYFWLSGFHPTWPVHQVMADEIVQGLEHL